MNDSKGLYQRGLDHRAEKRLETIRDWLIVRLDSAPNDDSRLEWILIALKRAYQMGRAD